MDAVAQKDFIAKIRHRNYESEHLGHSANQIGSLHGFHGFWSNAAFER